MSGMANTSDVLYRELAAAQERIAELEQREQRYRTIFENAMEGIFRITLDGRILLANPAMALMLGYQSTEQLLQNVTNVRQQLYVYNHEFTRLTDLLAANGVIHDFESQFYRSDGRIIWLSFNLRLVNQDGRPSYYEGTAQDITRRKEIEDQLRRRESQLTEVQGMVHLGSWEWDMAQNRVTWSDELFRIYGLDNQTFKATFEGYLERVHPDDRERVRETLGQAAQTAAPFCFEERVVRPDGAIRVLESNGKVVRDEQGLPIRMVGSCLDVTERKLAGKQIQESAERAEALVQTAAHLNAHIELDGALQTICRLTRQALKVGAVSVSLYDGGKRLLYHAADSGFPAIYRERVLPVEAPPSLLEAAGKKTRSFLIHDDARQALNDPNAQLYNDLDIQTIVSVGLIHKWQLIGTLNLHVRHQQRRFTDGELLLFKGLSDQAALAIVNAQLHAAGKEQAEKLLALYKVSKDINSILDLDALLNQIVRQTTQLVKAGRGLILLVDAPARKLEKLVPWGYEAEFFSGFSYEEVEDGISGWVLAQGRPVMTDDMAGDPRNTGLALQRLSLQPTRGESIIVAPLMVRDEAIGTLTTISPAASGPFTQADLELVLLLANQAAIAIENARLYQATKEYAAVLERRVSERTAELEQQNRKLVEARIRAEAADRLKSVFLAIMSHELRTPLNSIIGFTGILLQGLAGPLNGEQDKQLNMVQESAQHLLSLINDVLDISKIEAGQMEMASERVEIAPLIEKVAASFFPSAEKKGLRLVTAVDAAVPHTVGDSRRVEQILINLVGNALKFTTEGTIEIQCVVENGCIVTRVIDSGIGIDPEDLDKLFLPFSQIESGLSRSHDGTGLGLSICRRLVRLLGGEIWVHSEPEKGSVFGFSLPVRSA